MKRTKMMLAALHRDGRHRRWLHAPQRSAWRRSISRPASRPSGAQPASMLTMYRKGSLDPAGLADHAVDNATVGALHDAARSGDGRRRWSSSSPTANMPATELAARRASTLRNQELRITQRIARRGAEARAERAHGRARTRRCSLQGRHDPRRRLALHARRHQTEPVDLDFRATRYDGGVHVTIDGAPQGKCWSIPGVLEVSDCSLLRRDRRRRVLTTDIDATEETDDEDRAFRQDARW